MRAMLVDDFLKVRKCLDFLEQLPITTRKREKLNRECVSVAPDANTIECGLSEGHNAEDDVIW